MKKIKLMLNLIERKKIILGTLVPNQQRYYTSWGVHLFDQANWPHIGIMTKTPKPI
jgi:hypothetical protein